MMIMTGNSFHSRYVLANDVSGRLPYSRAQIGGPL
jgi:hypothetical protein